MDCKNLLFHRAQNDTRTSGTKISLEYAVKQGKHIIKMP